MSEDVSIGLKISITLIMMASFLASVVLVFYNTNALLESSQNNSIEAAEFVSIQNIQRLQRDYRRYVDLYKTYEYYEESINSISGVGLDGTFRIHYLRNATWVNEESPLKAVCEAQGLDGLENIDNMYSNFLNEYCDVDHSSEWISVTVYPDTYRQGYDIYYEVIDREGG